MALPQSISNHLADLLNLHITASQLLGGGCIHHAQRIHTERGVFVLKYNDRSQAHNFAVESQGLALLKSTGTLNVPEVLGTGEQEEYAWLVMEYIEPGIMAPDYWVDFGRSLAQLHKHSSSDFGLDYDNYIGALDQSNRYHSDWSTFFIEERLLPNVLVAAKRNLLNKADIDAFERLYQKLNKIFPQEPPALIHGDLWGGNILTGPGGKVAVIDPAVYYGHREIELAFMTLFDSQPQAFYNSYQSVYPLTPGWASRFDLYNLYPLLVHVNLFGGGYVGSVRRILKRYV